MADTSTLFSLGSEDLTVQKALSLADAKSKPVLSEKTIDRVNESADLVERIVNDAHPVYGINTGFGPLCTTKISKEETRQLQENILKSHAVGLGRPISDQLSKLMLITKAHALAKGYSGIRLATLERIIWHIENDAIPVVPSQGSVGASGDLAPLAHLFLPLIGLGEVSYKGKNIKGADLLELADLNPLTLGPKEGLALINGTQFILAHSIVVLDKM
ncbi:MAG: aromatic amino acid ammonia-lyase, partial [Bacteroidia bacterium]|nr:aromatic amino acid ammonia-lyase [Bacteroidia bacterium]